MKFTTCLFTIFGLLLAARALPSLVPYDENAVEVRGITSTRYSLAPRDEPFVREDDEIFERYFGQELDLTEREWAEGTLEPRQYAKVAEQAAELIIKGVIKIVDVIKGRIQKDKDVRLSVGTAYTLQKELVITWFRVLQDSSGSKRAAGFSIGPGHQKWQF
ncbi:hypothetical protein CPC08DRAFT_727726 [Agrocybe pediades]|nr:hypothetical protein CPC08DRAFT_727726 [Agrocybe pediades]